MKIIEKSRKIDWGAGGAGGRGTAAPRIFSSRLFNYLAICRFRGRQLTADVTPDLHASWRKASGRGTSVNK